VTLSALGVVAAVLPWVGWPKQVTVGVLVLTVLIGLGLVTAPPTRALKRGGIAPGARWHWGAAMLLGMSPAILLGLSFPVVSQKMAASTVSGTGLPVIVLSVSVAVPWLSQIIGTPVYRLLGDSLGRGPRAVLERYCSIWPALFLWALLPTALEILVVAAVTGWNLHVLGVHTALLLLHVVFVQSLIVADVAGDDPTPFRDAENPAADGGAEANVGFPTLIEEITKDFKQEEANCAAHTKPAGLLDHVDTVPAARALGAGGPCPLGRRAVRQVGAFFAVGNIADRPNPINLFATGLGHIN